MKIINSLFALAIASTVMVSCKETATAPEANNAVAEQNIAEGKTEVVNFHIDGMTCAMGCAKTIEKKLAKLDGVKSAQVDFEKQSARVEYDSNKQTPETLVETVEAVAGGNTYKVSDVKSSADQAMFIKEKEKEKEKKKNKKKKGAAEEKKPAAGCSSDAKPAGGCCAKKAAGCHSEKATM